MLSVVVPTFNEGKNIRNLVTQIDDALKGIPYEIVFVDDSKDDTPQVIMEVAKDFPAVRMEHRTGNCRIKRIFPCKGRIYGMHGCGFTASANRFKIYV